MLVKDNEQPLPYDRLISTKFSPLADIPNTACVKLILSNISGRPIMYKFKCDLKSLITVESDASGTIPAHGFKSCLLIWRRASEINSWKEMKPTSILMITEFKGSNDPNINEHTVTKIRCRISSSLFCNSGKPPEEIVTLKSSLDSTLLQNVSSDSQIITPLTGMQHLSNASQIKSTNAMSVKKGHLAANNAKSFHSFDHLEAKGALIIALIIVIIILCIQILFGNESQN